MPDKSRCWAAAGGRDIYISDLRLGTGIKMPTHVSR